ncbi:MAG: hypothetical protein IPM50_11195 [Acidobacteriota bacterium]|nr:MAG: hypothetical protein IPM50_11195 [Acidobacteriota bacterium]
MKPRLAWTLALVPVIVMTMLAMLPQVRLWQTTGENWAGSYAASNYDEVAYSAYVNGLMNGEPRRYDPYMARETKEESIFSIQFIPGYAIALPARALGVSASTAFIALHAFFAIFTSLAIFWLLFATTRSGVAAAGGTLVILCLGTAVTYEGYLRQIVEEFHIIEFFPFLRRYQPGFGFPLFFVMCAAAWQTLYSDSRQKTAWAAAAGVTFAAIVFSYFYLWTAALVWLAAAFAIAFIANKENRRDIFRNAAIVGCIGIAALLPYFYLLDQRSRNSDEVQLLVYTREPDLSAPTVIAAFIAFAVAAVLHFAKRIDARSPQAKLTYAFLAVPIVVLNQQVITGRSLQPIHYEIFIANYCVLAGICILLWLAFSGLKGNSLLPKVAFAVLGAAAAVWGSFEADHGAKRNFGMVAVREAVYPALENIRERSKGRSEPPVIHSANPIIASLIPTVVPAHVVWAPHLVAGGSVSEAEAKEQFYRAIYFSGFDAKDLEHVLKIRWFEKVAAIFGGGRALPELGGVNDPIEDDEIVAESQKYGEFVDSVTAAVAYEPLLNYFIVPDGEEPDWSNVERWYSRDGGTVIGLFRVYELKPLYLE